MRALGHEPFAESFRRLWAAGGAALVFALTVFAASPVAHDWLHADGSEESEAGCAVVLFSGGVSLPFETPAVVPPVALSRADVIAPARIVFLVTPRYLRQPERGPPSLG